MDLPTFISQLGEVVTSPTPFNEPPSTTHTYLSLGILLGYTRPFDEVKRILKRHIPNYTPPTSKHDIVPPDQLHLLLSLRLGSKPKPTPTYTTHPSVAKFSWTRYAQKVKITKP